MSYNEHIAKLVYEYVEVRNKFEASFKASIVKMYLRNARFAFLFGPICYLLTSRINNIKIKYIFLGSKYKDIIKNLNRNEVLILGGPKQLNFCYKNNLLYYSNCNIWRKLVNYMMGNTTSVLEKYFNNLVEFYNKFSGAKLVLENDSLPMQRINLLAARKANIKSICIQHGLMQNNSPEYIIDGFFTDEFFVMDEYSRKVFINKGVDDSKIKIMGYHSNFNSYGSIRTGFHRKVCFLGQPWSKYDLDLHKHYIKVVRDISNLLICNNISIAYKPHPWEDKNTYTCYNEVFSGSLLEAFDCYDVFISFTSTALYEANLSGKVAVQILDQRFMADDFSKYGYAYSIKVENIDSCLLKIVTSADSLGKQPVNYKPAHERFLACCDIRNDK